MDVSVVIPCFNRSKLVGRAIRSVLDQTLPPEEVIVVDDGSTDDSAEVAAAFGPPVRVIRTPNRGPSAARNTGIAEARGEWVAFLDSDDVWLPEKLVLQAEAAETFPAADLIFCDTTVMSGADTRIASRFALGGVYGTEVARNGPFLEFDRSIFPKLLGQSRVITSAVVSRRNIPHLRYPEKLEPSEDWALWLDLALRIRFAAVDQVLVRMFQNGDNISLHAARSARTRLATVERLQADPVLTAEERSRLDDVVPRVRFEALYYALCEGETAEARRFLRSFPRRSIGVGLGARYWLAARMPSFLLRHIARWRNRERLTNSKDGLC